MTDMFDEIFKRWVETGQLTENDIVPLFLEYDKEFLDGSMTPDKIIFLISHVQTDYLGAMNKILKYIGIKRGYEWEEVYDKNGKLLTRLWVNKN